MNQALQACTSDIERASLENLKCDLEEILNLTRETLNELKKPSNIGGVGGDDGNADEDDDDDDDPYAQEMAIFLAAINDCEGGSGSTSKAIAGNSNISDVIPTSPSTVELEKFKVIVEISGRFLSVIRHKINTSMLFLLSQNELDTIVGKKCSAPYTFAWGARSYHNALICGIETANIQQIHRMDDIQVIVLFTNPIHRNMIPCPFYLDGNCRFELNKCR